DARPDPRVVLLAENWWRGAFHASPAVLGTTLTIDRRTYTIVGVMPATLSWRVGGTRVVAWLPLDEASQRRAGGHPFGDAVARIRPGLTFDDAVRQTRDVVGRLQSGVPESKRWDVTLLPFDQRAVSGNRVRLALGVVLGAVGLVLLIACANVANLLL